MVLPYLIILECTISPDVKLKGHDGCSSSWLVPRRYRWQPPHGVLETYPWPALTVLMGAGPIGLTVQGQINRVPLKSTGFTEYGCTD